MMDVPHGKEFFAANPWPLAARAKELGLPTDRFRECDLIPDGQVIVVDYDELLRPTLDPLKIEWGRGTADS